MIDKAELFDVYHMAFPEIEDIIANSYLTPEGRYYQIVEVVQKGQIAIEEHGGRE